jgi:hypothetical protein
MRFDNQFQKAFREIGLVTTTQFKEKPLVNVAVSFKTAQALKKQGILK